MKRKTIIKMLLIIITGVSSHTYAADKNNQKKTAHATAEQNTAATLLQAACRGALERQTAQQAASAPQTELTQHVALESRSTPQTENDAATLIQAGIRGALARRLEQGNAFLHDTQSISALSTSESNEDSESSENLELSEDNEFLNLLLSQHNNDPQAALFHAAKTNMPLVVESLIQRRANINAHRRTGGSLRYTPLMDAIEAGNAEVIQTLIDHRADVNTDNPLQAAIYADRADIVQILIAANANVNEAYAPGWTPLIITTEQGSAEIEQLLITANADVDVIGHHGRTPLTHAARTGHLDSVQRLMTAGANLHATDNYGNTPLTAALKEGHVDIVQMLIAAGANIDINMVDTQCLLNNAIQNGYIELAQILIAAGANVNTADQSLFTPLRGYTPLMQATHHGHIEIIETLIWYGAYIDASTLMLPEFLGIIQYLIESYRKQLAEQYPENLMKFLPRDFEQFNSSPTLLSIAQAFNAVAEIITRAMSDNDRRNLVRTRCGVFIKAAVNGKNIQSHEIKSELFYQFLNWIWQQLMVLEKEYADNQEVVEAIKTVITFLNQELTQGHYIRESEEQNNILAHEQEQLATIERAIDAYTPTREEIRAAREQHESTLDGDGRHGKNPA